jgi:hypothetical protein
MFIYSIELSYNPRVESSFLVRAKNALEATRKAEKLATKEGWPRNINSIKNLGQESIVKLGD